MTVSEHNKLSQHFTFSTEISKVLQKALKYNFWIGKEPKTSTHRHGVQLCDKGIWHVFYCECGFVTHVCGAVLCRHLCHLALAMGVLGGALLLLPSTPTLTTPRQVTNQAAAQI